VGSLRVMEYLHSFLLALDFLLLTASNSEFSLTMRSTHKLSLLTSFLVLSLAINNVQANYGNYPCTDGGSSPFGSESSSLRPILSEALLSPMSLTSYSPVPADNALCQGKPKSGSSSQCIYVGNGEFACGAQGSSRSR